MKPKPKKAQLVAKAQAMATAAAKGTVFAFATRDAKILEAANASAEIAKIELATHVCAECGTHTVSSMAEPFCATCGSAEVSKAVNAAKIEVPSDDKVVAVACNSCGHIHTFETAVVKAARNELFCTSCGTSLVQKAAADDGADLIRLSDEGLDTDTELAVDPAEEAKAKAKASKKSLSFNVKANDFDIDPVGDAVAPVVDPVAIDLPTDEDVLDFGDDPDPSFEAAENADDPAPELEPTSIGEGSDAPTLVTQGDADELPMNDITVQAAEGDDAEDEETAAEDDEEGKEEATAEDLAPDFDEGQPIADALEMDDQCVDVAFVAVGSRLIALKAGVSIASLKPSRAGANKDVMFQPAFAQAVEVTAKKQGLRKALSALGFRMICTKSVTKATVDSAVNKVKAASAATASAQREVFSESLAIASAGFARSLWKGKANPILDAVTSQLRSAGVRNAKHVAKRILVENNTAFIASLLEVTDKLSRMTKESRQSYVELLASTEPDADAGLDMDQDSDVSVSEVEDELEDVTARFVQPARKVGASVMVASTNVLDRLQTTGLKFLN